MSYVDTLEPSSRSRRQTTALTDPFDYWQTIADRAEWVESPNQRRKGSSGVKFTTIQGNRVYIKLQSGHGHYGLRHPFGRATALREVEAIEACHRLGITAPQICYCGTRGFGAGQRALLVTHALDGYCDFDEFLETIWPALSNSERMAILDQMAFTFAQLHRAHWQHSALYPKHVFVRRRSIADDASRPDYQIALIDLEKSRKRLRIADASRHDMRQFRKHAPSLSTEAWETLLRSYLGHLNSAHQSGPSRR